MHVMTNELVTIIIGQKRAGKSTYACKIARAVQKLKSKGITCYCNYPVRGTKMLPLHRDKYGRLTLDKDTFYRMDLSNSVVIIDEAAGIWNARSHKNFTEIDSNFFNCLGHIGCQVFLICQFIDMIDLNLRRSAGEVWYCRKLPLFFSGITKVERSYCSVEKVKSTQEEVLTRGFDVVDFKVCLRPIGSKYFIRRKYYKDFFSTFVDREMEKINCPSWSDVQVFPVVEKRTFKNLFKKNNNLAPNTP